MSFILVGAVQWIAPSMLPATQKAVLCGIAERANDDGGAWPDLAELAHKASITERSVRSTLRALEDGGWVTTTIHGGGTARAERYRPNFYQIDVSRLREALQATYVEMCAAGRKGRFPKTIGRMMGLDQGGNDVPVSPAQGGTSFRSQGGTTFLPTGVQGGTTFPTNENYQKRELPEENQRDTSCRAPQLDVGADPTPEAKTRRRALSADELRAWQPDDKLREWTRATNPKITRDDLDDFRDHYLATGKRVLDPDATWRGWVRRSLKYGTVRERAGDRRPGRATHNGPTVLDLMTFEQHVVTDKALGDTDTAIARRRGCTVEDVRAVLNRTYTAPPTPAAAVEDDDIVDAEILDYDDLVADAIAHGSPYEQEASW
jgi:hypothetical protein